MPLLEGEDRWPPFGKISVAFEGFVYYVQYSTKVVIHDLEKYFPTIKHVTIHHSIMMLAAVGSFGFAYFSDDYFGKYRSVLLFYLIGSFGPIIGLFGLVYPSFGSGVRGWIYTASLYLWAPILAIEATRVALMSEQFKIPQTLRSLKLFYFFIMVSRYAGAGAAGLLMKVESYFGGSTTQLIIRTAISMLVAIIYTLILILVEKRMRRKRVEVGVVDNVIGCIFSALYNRAFRRRKMPEDCKWIEFANAKYFKETRDSALQLVEMSLIYMPFSMFFGLNEFLDVIWLEQNEWIGNDDAFLSSLSIITVYHTIDVILLPLFEYLIEFVLPKFKIVLSDLQLIGTAIFLLGLAYLATTVLQSYIENGDLPRLSSATVRFFDGMASDVKISTPFSPTIVLNSGESFDITDVKPFDMGDSEEFRFQSKIFAILVREVSLVAKAGSISTYVLTDDGVITLPYMKIHFITVPEIDVINSVGGLMKGFRLRFHKLTHESKHGGHGGHGGGHGDSIDKISDDYEMGIPEVGKFEKLYASKGKWKIGLYLQGNLIYEEVLKILPNSKNTVFVCYDKNKSMRFSLRTGTKAQTVTLLLAMPQILLRCFADGIGKISTYFFTYTQAPRKLRSTAFGVLYFAQFSFPSFIGLLSSAWMEGFSSFTLSIYTLIVFVSLIFFMRFALKYEEI